MAKAKRRKPLFSSPWQALTILVWVILGWSFFYIFPLISLWVSAEASLGPRLPV